MAGRPRKLGPEDQNRILELRDQHGMTLAAIAKEYSVGIATVSRICSLGSGTQTALRRTNEPSGTANTDSGSVGDTKVANRHIGNRETSSWKPGGNETGTEPRQRKFGARDFKTRPWNRALETRHRRTRQRQNRPAKHHGRCFPCNHGMEGRRSMAISPTRICIPLRSAARMGKHQPRGTAALPMGIYVRHARFATPPRPLLTRLNNGARHGRRRIMCESIRRLRISDGLWRKPRSNSGLGNDEIPVTMIPRDHD